jgi:hypothetical protein
MSKQCHQCGQVWDVTREPGRQETCEKCGADWKVCLNCAHYDPKVAHQCRERRAEPVDEKDRANYCEWFELGEDRHVGGPSNFREDAARERLKKLLGD